METAREMVRATAPLLYFAGLVVVIVCVMNLLWFIEYSIGFADYEGDGRLNALTMLHFNGDVPAVVSLALIGAAVFGALGSLLSWSEGPRSPTLADHGWRCALLYVLAALSGVVVVAEYSANYGADASGVSDGYVVAVAMFLAAGYVIFLDALMLSWRGRHAGVDAGAST